VPLDHASRTLAQQSLEARLGELPRKTPIGVPPDTPLSVALATMRHHRVGSLLVQDERGAPVGILTRYDVIDRITLPQLPLSTPVSQVMSSPVCTLTARHTVHDAALLMSRKGIRHVPVMEGARVVSLVSERDVFALQRMSLRQISSAMRGATDLPTLVESAKEIRRFAQDLLVHGVGARQLTQLISHLNDVLTVRLVHLMAGESGVDMGRACWLALGSEGRSEQTLATDQDNGLVFESDDPEADRPRWLAFGRRVNEALDACGYPLCRGKVMAGEPQCCLTPAEWIARFRHWMEHGAPADLLASCIYFDFRGIAGHLPMALPLREWITHEAAKLPRFLKQMAENALANEVPLNWLGGIDTRKVDGHNVLDLKLHGAMLFVDAARLYALRVGSPYTNTRERLQAVGLALEVPPQESESWVGAFEVVQTLRLRAQLQRDGASGNPNLIDVDRLSDMDRRMLRESLRVAKRLQQRMELDYRR
jgi:CBS domain-containing protein